MNLLLDTCTFVWLVSDPDRLSQTVVETIDDARNDLALSDVSVWEICLKWQVGKIGLPVPPRPWIEQQVETWRLDRVEIQRAHLYRVSELPRHHQDPFDRLLVAQSIEGGLTLVTPDRAIRQYPAAVLW